MRKLYCRRFSLSSINLTILFLCFILIMIKSWPSRPIIITCLNNPFGPSSTIPPHYLIIPYREFALRTSISCHSYTLDAPKKNYSKIYPKYSPYLRGTFPYVIPYTNVTFQDVEKFYTKILVNKTNTTISISTSFATNITFERVPYKFRDGMWRPIGYKSAQRTAILIPLQGRDYNAKTFLFNIHAFARRQLLTYKIYLVEQVSPLGHRFNKGRLYNAGVRYIEEEGLNMTCLILHDVDLLPENDANFYTCESKHPKHTTVRVRPARSKQRYNHYYEFLIGGVLILSFEMYHQVNGFSNSYWGWGGEDDDLSLRFIERKLCVVRPEFEAGSYAALPHPRGQRNNARFGLLTWSTVRIATDGINQIGPMTKVISTRRTATVTHLKLDVDADQSLYRPPPLEKYSFLTNQANDHITTSNQPLTHSTSTASTVSKTV